MNFRLEIQSWSEVPSVAHFCSLFCSPFNLPDFDIEDLEEALLCDSSESTLDSEQLSIRLLPELIVALLKGCDCIQAEWPFITTSNYQMFLRRLFRKKFEEHRIDNPFNSDTDFQSLTLRTKVTILNYLCDFRLDSVDVEHIVSNIEADSLRIEPLGFDNNDSAYWYFFGTRLYREDYNTKKTAVAKSVWQVICFTEDDWQHLTAKFARSKSRKESALFKTLNEDFLPTIPNLFKAKEQERRRRLLQPRTSSRIKIIKDIKLQQQLLHQSKYGEEPQEQTEDNQNLTYHERILEERRKEVESLTISREKIRAERAVRAQRRSRSTSINSLRSYASSDAYSQDVLIYREDIAPETPPIVETHTLEDKENIFSEKQKKHKSKRNRRISGDSKMAPTATKLPGRQTNNSLSSITGQIVIQPPAAGASTPTVSKKEKKKAKAAVGLSTSTIISSLSFTETDEVLQIGMHKVLEYVKNHDDAWPFMDPVEEDIAPRYYSIIRRPMDLLKMEEKLDNGEYQRFSEFRNDFKLIVNNCRLYNGQANGNEYTEMVNNLQLAFTRSTKKYFEQNSSDEEANLDLLEYPEMKPNVFKEKPPVKSEPIKKEKDKKIKHMKKTIDSSDDEVDATEPNKSMKSSKSTKSFKSNVTSSPEKLSKSTKTVAKDKEKEKEKDKDKDKEKQKEARGIKRKRKEKDKDKEKHKKQKTSFDDEKPSKKLFEDSDDGMESEVFEDSDIEETKVKKLDKKAKHVKPEKAEKVIKPEKVEKAEKSKKKKDRSPSPEPLPDISQKKEKKAKKEPKLTPKTDSYKSTIKNKKLRTPSPSPARSTNPEPLIKNKKSKPNKSLEKEEKVEKAEKPDKTKKEKKIKKLKAKLEESEDEPAKTPKIEKPGKREKPEKLDKLEKAKKKAEIAAKKLALQESKREQKAKKEPKKREDKAKKTTSTPKKKEIKTPKSASNQKKPKDDISTSSKSFSRSPSPLASIRSMSSEDLNASFESDFPPKDKYDLIKERRSKKGQSESLDRSRDGSIKTSPKDKNHKLKETIEKLKLKEKRKGAFMGEILSSVKPSKREKEDNTIFQRLREPSGSKPLDKVGSKADEYNFVDDLEPQGPAPKKSKKEKVDKPEKPEKPEKVAKPEKVSKKSKEKKALAPTTVPEVKRPPKETNITALQVETQQTLKDINKWLNDTPYASAGNSPSRYNLDDFDAVAVTIDEADFRKPMIPPLLASPNTSAATGDNNPLKESNNNKLVPGGAPSSSHQKKDPKDPKRKTLKQIIQPRKKDHQQRTIDRLQPGKTKGNLLSNIQNINKPEELFPLGAANKVKEVKNSLIVKTDESGPKLSLGTVLDTEDFGLIQQHNFNEDSGDKTAEKNVEEDEEDPKTEEIKDKDEKKVDKEVDSEKAADKDLLLTPSESKPVGFKNDVKKDEKEVEGSGKGADSKKEAPNFNAWFKAFGAPKKPKKTDEEESKDLKEGTSPRQRQRKASTGSTVSERSSYSQDPDSPRIAIDERLGGAYPAPYPSPIGASPVMASPKTEDLQKAAYPLNGAIKVGFYQDMTSTKSSPEKSSSPREMPSPYPQYSQHLYSTPQSATSPSIYNTYNTSYNPPTDAIPSKAVTYSKSTASPASYYDQYKQPMSQESDFNNSMSPSTNPNSPYHSQQSSPYQQQPNSPFQQGNQFQTPNQAPSTPGTQGPNSPYSQPNSPYQQPQASPYHMQQSQQNTQQKHQGPNSPFSNPSSPYSQHDPNSPYGSGQLSPYGQTVSPKATPNNSINTNNAINPINQVNTANQTKTAAPEWPATNLQSKVPPSVPVNYQPPQQPAHFNVPPQTQQQSQQHQMGPSASPQSQQNIAQSLQLGYQNPPANFSLPNYDAKKKTDEQQANIFEATMKNQQRSNMPEMINLGYSGTDSSGNKPAENKTAANIAANIALNAAKQQEQSNKFLDLTKQQHQQQMYNIMNYNKPLDFGKPQEISKTKAMDMFNRAATLNFPKNPFPPTAGVNSPASCSKPNEYSGPNPNLYGALSSSGNPGNVPTNPGITSAANTAHVTKPGMESTPDYSLVQKNMAYAKPVEQPKQPNSFPTGNMTQHQNKMQATPQPEVPKNPPATATELNIPNMPNMNMQRFDPIRHSANMANMDMNYKNPPFNASPASMMNLASFMRDFQTEDPRSLLGLTGQAPSSYYDTKNIPPAHMFGKNLQHSNAPNSIQQMLMSNTMNSMSSMAQYSSREQHNLNMNFQNRMQQAPAVVPPSAAAPPAVEKPKRSRKKKNATPDVPAQVQQQPSAQNMTNQHQMQQQQLAHQQQGFQSYAGIKTTGPQPTSAEASAISLKTASVVPGSAFNFGPGPAGLGLYENSSYLEDYRGTSNPYYAPPLGHRSTPDPSSIETQKNPPPAHPPQASSPYHQYLTHQSRPSYPFMNHHPSLDIHQWQQQSQELSRQMMMNQGLLGNSGSSTTYPSGYHPAMGMHTRPHWM